MAAERASSERRPGAARGNANRLVFGEGRVMLEPARLAMNSFRLATQPRGDGRAVLVLPGLGATDTSTVPLRSYLRGLNYDARGWGLGQNDGNVSHFVREVVTAVERISGQSGRPVPLVGWSLGGVVSREVARQVPELVEQVITLGSPVIRGRRDARVGAVPVPATAIYTKEDGVVPWRASIDRANPHVEHVEVRSTHFGLGVHHAVYIEIAQRLHAARTRRNGARNVNRP
jgi:pimeloyl-ACP methyl ester carboxylesterase